LTTGPFLYDDDPAPLHTGTPRSGKGLVVLLFGGTAVLAVLLVVLMPLLKGSPEEQATEAAGVFVAALAAGDVETAYGLLCEDERDRVAVGDLEDEYAGSGTASVIGAEEVAVDGEPTYEVTVRWSGGGTDVLSVINEDGASVCGVR
jgi:hypothetical protein